MNKIIVIGGGPAGMFAAIAAAETGSQVILLEKNEKLGKKLFITGKGRCNITNAGDMDNLFANVMTNAKFLYSAFYFFLFQHFLQCCDHIRGMIRNRKYPVATLCFCPQSVSLKKINDSLIVIRIKGAI